MKSSFKTILTVALLGEQLFKCTEDLVYDRSGYTITVKKGFVFNGLSKPQAVWSIVGCPFGGLDSAAGALHDALYSSHLVDRRTADYLFYEALLSCGVSKVKARAVYYAVRELGEPNYAASFKEIAAARELVYITLKD